MSKAAFWPAAASPGSLRQDFCPEASVHMNVPVSR